jgi:hypothetical protein
LLDLTSFVRVVAFGVVYAGIEYRYVNRYEKDWPKSPMGGLEKPVFWAITPYHLYLLLPLFIIVSFATSITAWAGNAFFLAVLEDVVYFVWRGKAVTKADWTTTLFGSFTVDRFVIPIWWPLDIVVAGALFLSPV